MKTCKFKITRAFSAILIIATVLSNLIYLGFFTYNYKIFEIERSLMFEQTWTLRSFSLYLVYLNLISSFLFGYAFNIASKYLIKVAIWIALTIDGFGVFSCVYTRLFAANAMTVALQTNMFSPGSTNLGIFERYPGQSLIDIQKNFSLEYGKVMKYFEIFEGVSLIGLLCLIVCGVSARFMKVTVEKECVPHFVEETVGNEVTSLRPVHTMISLRV